MNHLDGVEIALYVLGACIVGLIVVVIWASYSDWKDRQDVQSGTVISKNFEPEHETTWLMPVTVGKTTTYIPQTIEHPDEWSVCIEGYAPDGEKKQVWHPISEAEYDDIEIGQSWSVLGSR